MKGNGRWIIVKRPFLDNHNQRRRGQGFQNEKLTSFLNSQIYLVEQKMIPLFPWGGYLLPLSILFAYISIEGDCANTYGDFFLLVLMGA